MVQVFFLLDLALQASLSISLFTLFTIQKISDRFHDGAPNFYKVLHYGGLLVTSLCLIKAVDPQAVIFKSQAWVITVHMLKALTVVFSMYYFFAVCYLSIMAVYVSKSGEDKLPNWFDISILSVCLSTLPVAIACEVTSFVYEEAFVIGIYFLYVGIAILSAQIMSGFVYIRVTRSSVSNGSGRSSVTTEYQELHMTLKKRLELHYEIAEKLRYRSTLAKMKKRRSVIEALVFLAAVINTVTGVSIILIDIDGSSGRNLSDGDQFNFFRDSNYGSDYFVYIILCIVLWHSWLSVRFRANPAQRQRKTGLKRSSTIEGELSPMSSSSPQSVSRISFTTGTVSDVHATRRTSISNSYRDIYEIKSATPKSTSLSSTPGSMPSHPIVRGENGTPFTYDENHLTLDYALMRQSLASGRIPRDSRVVFPTEAKRSFSEDTSLLRV